MRADSNTLNLFFKKIMRIILNIKILIQGFKYLKVSEYLYNHLPNHFNEKANISVCVCTHTHTFVGSVYIIYVCVCIYVTVYAHIYMCIMYMLMLHIFMYNNYMSVNF